VKLQGKLQPLSPDQANKKKTNVSDPRGWMMAMRSLVGALHEEESNPGDLPAVVSFATEGDCESWEEYPEKIREVRTVTPLK